MSRLWEELNAQSRAAARAEYALEQALDAGDVANIARAELDTDFELYRRAAGEVIERSQARGAAERDRAVFFVYALLGVVMILIGALVKVALSR